MTSPLLISSAVNPNRVHCGAKAPNSGRALRREMGAAGPDHGADLIDGFATFGSPPVVLRALLSRRDCSESRCAGVEVFVKPEAAYGVTKHRAAADHSRCGRCRAQEDRALLYDEKARGGTGHASTSTPRRRNARDTLG